MNARLKAMFVARVLPPALSVLCAVALGMLILVAMKRNPFEVMGEVGRMASMAPHGVRDDLAYILAYATPLIFSGLAVALAFRAGLFNIGGTGQIMIGSLACGLVGWKLAALPGVLLVPLCVLSAGLAGAGWAAIAGVLKAWRGSHEVIITIMLNFLAVSLTEAVVTGPLKDPHGMASQLPEIGHHARLSRLHDVGLPIPHFVPVSTAFFLSLAAAAVVWVWLFRTTRGYELRAVGHNPDAARAAGISVRGTTVLAMALSGALAGLAATDLVLGNKHNYRQDEALGYAQQGFIGIAVALMGQNHPAGIIFAALLFAALQRLGLLFQTVPKDLILILQAAVILFVIAGNEIFRRRLARAPVTA